MAEDLFLPREILATGAQDYDALYAAGVSAIYGPGTNIPDAVVEVIALLNKTKEAAQ